MTATVAGVAGAGNFTLTNTAGAAAGIAATGGTAQSTAINTAFGSPLQATVTDSYGNPVSGVTVTFTLPGSGAGGTFAGGGNTAVTNGQGAEATSGVLTANGFAGNFTVTAAAAGVGSTASFSLTNTAGAAGSIVASGGSGQSVVVNTAFAAVFQATVVDVDNNPVPNVTVTFTAPGSGVSGTFAGNVRTYTAASNAAGVVTTPVFTANTIAGSYSVTATSGMLSASFSLSNVAGAAASIGGSAGSGGRGAQIQTAFAQALHGHGDGQLRQPR